METLTPELTNYELERGKPMPSLKHARVQKKLLLELTRQLATNMEALPEIAVALPQQRVTPDVAVFEVAQLPNPTDDDETAVTAVPLTVFEILSPTQTIGELLDKAKLYFANGVQSYWLVLPELRAVAVYAMPGKYRYFYNGQAVLDPVLGVELPVSPLFD